MRTVILTICLIALVACLDNRVDDVNGNPSSAISITGDQLCLIVPKLKKAKCDLYAGYLNKTFQKFSSSFTSKLQVAHFLAQMCHESGGLQWFKEFASGKAYEGRKDLGNTHPGDGVKYKGRGPIQITGRYTYEKCGKYLGLDLVNNPTLLEQPENGFKSAAWFWCVFKPKLNSYAAKDDIKMCTKLVNGGYNGLTSRKEYLKKAKVALKI